MDDAIQIGYVEEDAFGVEPDDANPITCSSLEAKSIEGKLEKRLTVGARFDCPCCGRGIRIEINTEVSNE